MNGPPAWITWVLVLVVLALIVDVFFLWAQVKKARRWVGQADGDNPADWTGAQGWMRKVAGWLKAADNQIEWPDGGDPPDPPDKPPPPWGGG